MSFKRELFDDIYWKIQLVYDTMGLSEQEGFRPMQVRLRKEQADFLARKLYETKSEKTSALEREGQMSLFDEMERCADPDAYVPNPLESEKQVWASEQTGGIKMCRKMVIKNGLGDYSYKKTINS